MKYFNPYLNFHRPCGFASFKVDKKGKEKKVYRDYLIPYAVLKGMRGAKNFLKPEITFEKLDKITYQYSDNDFAGIMEKENPKLYETIEDLKNDGLVPQDSVVTLENLTSNNLASDLLSVYRSRFGQDSIS